MLSVKIAQNCGAAIARCISEDFLVQLNLNSKKSARLSNHRQRRWVYFSGINAVLKNSVSQRLDGVALHVTCDTVEVRREFKLVRDHTGFKDAILSTIYWFLVRGQRFTCPAGHSWKSQWSLPRVFKCFHDRLEAHKSAYLLLPLRWESHLFSRLESFLWGRPIS